MAGPRNNILNILFLRYKFGFFVDIIYNLKHLVNVKYNPKNIWSIKKNEQKYVVIRCEKGIELKII